MILNFPKYIINTFVDLIFPPFCKVTYAKLEKKEIVYSNKILFKYEIAGSFLEIKEQKHNDNIKENFHFNNFYCLFNNFNEIQDIIHTFKYLNYSKLGMQLGDYLAKKIELESNIKYDYLIPVPLHKVKLRTRTFNQATKIAEGIKERLNIEINEDIIKRVKFTNTQTKLNKEQRKKNLENVFKVNPDFAKKIEGKNILIIDDVFTTGSTINAIAKELSEFSPINIDCATIVMAGK